MTPMIVIFIADLAGLFSLVIFISTLENKKKGVPIFSLILVALSFLVILSLSLSILFPDIKGGLV